MLKIGVRFSVGVLAAFIHLDAAFFYTWTPGVLGHDCTYPVISCIAHGQLAWSYIFNFNFELFPCSYKGLVVTIT